MGFFEKNYLVVLSAMIFTSVLVAQEKVVIAFAQDNMANDFRKAQVFEAMEEANKHANVEFIYSDAKAKASLLIRHIEKFSRQEVDALIIGTNDTNIVVPAVEKAYEQGIVVIVLDRKINTSKYSCYINSDNYKIGQMAARYLHKKMPKGGVVLMLQGLVNNDVAQARDDGFSEEIKKYKNISILKRRGNYLRKDTILEMEKLKRDNIAYDAIYAHSDSMLSGVRIFYQKHDLDISLIPTIGVDYTTEAREAIRQGRQSASILFPLSGKEAVAYALDILEQKPTPRTVSMPIKLITKDNIDAVKPIF